MNSHETLTTSLEQSQGSLNSPGQAAWLPELRQKGLEQFQLHGLPARSVERWKYTRLDTLEQSRLPAPSQEQQEAALPEPLVSDTLRVAMLNGRYTELEGKVSEGLKIMPLEQALSEDDSVLTAMLQSLDISDHAASMSALNTATLQHGLYLYVEPGMDAGELLVQWAASPAEEGFLANARVCVVLGDGARLRLIEQFESVAGTAQTNLVTQVSLGSSSRLEHVRLQQESERSVLVTLTDVGQSKDSHYTYSGLDFGGGTVRHDVRARLQEEGAACSLNGASLARGRSHIDNHLDAEHLAENCTSRQYFRAVLADRSRVVFNGRVYVAVGADGTDAEQSSAGLLLSPLAEIDSKPELEIYADEVVASHGATVGQIDPDQLFYLQSRGLDRDAARTLLTMAFCQSVIEHLEGESLRATLEKRLQTCLDAVGVSDA